LIQLGQLAAEIFNQVIIKEDDDTRGRERGEVADLILKGVKEKNSDLKCEIILDEVEAIHKGLDQASYIGNDSLVVIFPDTVSRTINLIKDRQR
jgi:cyanophycin synthetase